MILQKLKADAEAYLGEKVTEAVITVPAYFTDAPVSYKHLGAMGTTRLHGAQIIRRGYENLDGKLVSMGADIAVKVTEPVSELALPRAD